MHSFELHSNESACRKSGSIGLEQVQNRMTSCPFFSCQDDQAQHLVYDGSRFHKSIVCTKPTEVHHFSTYKYEIYGYIDVQKIPS